MCVRTLPASAATEAAFPGLAIDRIEAEKTRKHASLIERYRPGDQFVPAVTDEHGALGPAGRALARRVCARAPNPALALTYGVRRLAVVAARRVHAIMHTKVLRVPPPAGPVEPDNPYGPHHADGDDGRLGGDPPHDPHPDLVGCEADLLRAPVGDGDGTAHSPMAVDDAGAATEDDDGGGGGGDGGVDGDGTGGDVDGDATGVSGGGGISVGGVVAGAGSVFAAAAGAGTAAFSIAHGP